MIDDEPGRETGSRDERDTDPADTDAQDDRTDDATTEVDTEVVDLQLLLEQIAASAGDPPEHGLAGVAARRRRRKRHRRGAVATAMTLAAVVGLAAPFMLNDDGHDVTADSASSEVQRAELPDTVQLTCARTGIDVPVASIRPQANGLHVEVFNELPGATQVWVRAVDEDDPEVPVWDSGPLYVARGRHELTQPVPPGVLTVGCRIAGVEQQRQVELVDVDSSYKAPELACDEEDRTTLTDLTVANASGEPARSYVAATQAALRQLTHWDDADVSVTKPRGYPEQGFGSWSYQPMTEVVKDGDAVALVYLAGDDEEAPASVPWTRAPQVDVCKDFLNDAGLALAGA